ncbi:hypothetical protein OSSY52_06530 [Tepiditoga spiralis]|uniref:Uncharacterized protein n=1 Tax=Tepiditoga spiralis TaxID=2108365 RepID=A0A7G1G8X7_9BACT|nr:hypothetical protein [Tepiditoga spiralis]BBE30512.1 hypothetical protein OSSY52_06530 [Tepiditoga spiralis]
MKKVILVVFALAMAIGIFAADPINFNYNGNDWVSNGNVDKTANVSISVYQWIYANVQGNSLTITKPGELKDQKIVDFVVASNDEVVMNIDTNIDDIEGLDITRLQFWHKNVQTGNVYTKDYGKTIDRIVYKPRIIDNGDGTYKFDEFALNADFDVALTLKAAGGNKNPNADDSVSTQDPYILNVNFHFEPTTTF